MEHYYSAKPTVKHDRKQISTVIRGESFHFQTDAGVFSKKGLDYGTRVLLDSIELPSTPGAVLDVGCGYGPIGITIAKLAPHLRVTMIDMNERAIELAQDNARLHLDKTINISIFASNLYEKVPSEQRFQLIVSNPPIRAGKDVVHRIFTEGYKRLTDGGSMWIVIQKKQGAPSALAKLESVFSDVEVVNKDKGYYIIRANKH